MTDAELLSALIEGANVPTESFMSYKAGYYESTLLSMMARFPEVRKEIGERARMANWDKAV
jgi:hypothetical protein